VSGPEDAAAPRREIEEALDTNLVVVAGAGTGKTTALVSRVVALVRSDKAQMGEIAAITFTEAAAAELRERIRGALETAAEGGGGGVRLASARDDADDAAISTLHSFAQRILVDQCVDAGLPPGFEVLDDTAEVADFESRWARFADQLFADPGAERPLVLGLAAGLRPADLARVAWNLHTDWDRLEDGGIDALEAVRRCDDDWPDTGCLSVLDALDRALAGAPRCSDDADNLLLHLRGTLTEARNAVAETVGDPLAALQTLVSLPSLRCNQGRKENWDGGVAEVRALCAEAEDARGEVLERVRRAVLGDLVARIARFTLDAAEERRIEGRLTFHDLLVHARRLVRRGGSCLETLRRRYRRLLIDEFQDTDPIQIELAARLASAVDGDGRLDGARPGSLFVVGDPQQSIYRFRRAEIELFARVGTEIGNGVALHTNFRSVPGIIDFVNVVFGEVFGDGSKPGQAPHRPLASARQAPDDGDDEPSSSGPAGGEAAAAPSEQLAFDGLGIELPPPTPIRRGRRTEAATSSLPAPVAPVPVPRVVPVVAVGGPVDGNLPEVRRLATADAVAAIDRVVRQGWLVEDVPTGKLRPSRFGDVAVLIPARSVLPALEEAFEDAGVPYRLEGAALLWGAEEVREVLAVLRAADDPVDAVAVLAALRSPGLACGDDDLVRWHASGGTWDPRDEPPVGMEGDPVAAAMTVLARLHEQRWWSEPSAMVATVLSELRVFELALAYRRPRDHWQRLRWLEDQARLFDETVGGTLGAFLVWADLRAAGDGRIGGIGPPDPDDDAVRVMTVHGAKGLEFPVVVLAGLERDPADAPPAPAVLWGEDAVPEVHIGEFQTAGFEQLRVRDLDLDILEQHRLLYVGMTRARDHLVVCLHHKQKNSSSEPSLGALVAGICERNSGLWRALPGLPMTFGTAPIGTAADDGTPPASSAAPITSTPVAPGRPPVEAMPLPPGWEDERARLLARLRRRPVTSATAVAEHTKDGTVDERPTVDPGWPTVDPGWPTVDPGGADLWSAETDRGEEARRIGRAVHAVLAEIDLAATRDPTDSAVEKACIAQAHIYGVAGGGVEIATMVRRALESDVVQRAAARRHWREVFVAAPVGEGVLEGFVDLLYEDDGGLVVVDYKTDRLVPESIETSGGASYRLQVASYAETLEASTGVPVVRCVLLYVGAATPVEHVIEGEALAGARTEARRVVDVLVAG
jgi:ATP-dependent helicase/nuclease subunit A